MGPVAPPEPPSYEAAINDATGWSNSGLITEDEAIRALRTHCKTLFCWGEGPIEKMKINTLKPSTGFMVSNFFTLRSLFFRSNQLDYTLIFILV